jgi:two-component system, chemotaxis family, CheB/CheR fusion protein
MPEKELPPEEKEQGDAVSGEEELPESMEADAAEATAPPSHYAGIGASAGGLEALEQFFDHMTADSGLAFVVVQHLSPQYKSLMVEILSKHTMMPVLRAEDGMRVEADTIYLIPPKKNLRIFHGKLLLSEQEHDRGINLPIDIFLRSLAEDQGEKAIGIILSGTGSDGMRGVRAIKESGGMVMVQDAESAKFDGMPRSAISTGLADFVLPPGKMPEQLLSFVKHPYVNKTDKNALLLTDEDSMARLFELLREKTGIDFTWYKQSTVTRRIERRMTINQIEDLRDYVRHLERFPREVLALHRELLIGVTSFFRDHEAFGVIRQEVLPELFRRDPEAPLRFWIAGCSTGEEAYSLAILCCQYMEETGLSRDIKIFATDIDKQAVERASMGAYPESIAADVSAELLARYFYRKDDMYHVNQQVREMVVFAAHNLLKDPPFTRIDFLSCRNLLIYLQTVLQKKVLSFFQFSLKAGSFLFLGASETVGPMAEYFELVDSKWKLFRNRGGRRPLISDTIVQPDVRAQTPYTPRMPGRAMEEDRLLDRLLQAVTGDYLPPSVVINENQELVHVFGEVQDFFRMQPGRMTNEIIKMAHKSLSIPLATGLHKAFKGEGEVRYTNIRVQGIEKPRVINMRIRMLPEKKGQDRLAVVFLETREEETVKTADDTAIRTYDASEESQQRIQDLEQELQYTRENLQATIEELETSNEELQATNEELLASNEELQSTNEELQSVNEELYTVNAEHQTKIQELVDLNNDMDNLLQSTQIGTLFLDEEGRIRKLTPAVKKVINVLEQDVGRPIAHLSHGLEGIDLAQEIENALKTDTTREQEVKTASGEYYLMRAQPFRTSTDVVAGATVTFVNISPAKQARDALSKEQQLVQMITESAEAGILFMDNAGAVTFCNPAARELLGVDAGALTRHPLSDPAWDAQDENGEPIPPDLMPAERVLAGKSRQENRRLSVRRPDGTRMTLAVYAAPLLDRDGNVAAVVKTLNRADSGNPGKARTQA